MFGSLLVVGCLLAAQVDGVPNKQLDASVRRLVRQLDSSQLAERDQAEQALIELGPDVLNHLPRITSRTPAEVKERLSRVIGAIEKLAAESVGKSSRVTLQGEMTLVEALNRLEQQTGNAVAGYEDRSGTVKLDLEDVPYWEALDQILDQAQLTINPFGGKVRTLSVQARPDGQLPRYGSANYSGPFRFEAVRIQTRRDLRNRDIEGMQLTLDVSWEPRNTPIVISQPLSDLKVLDEDSVEIDVDGQGARSAAVNADISSVELDLPLTLPERSVEKIARVRGTLRALLPGRVETFEFENAGRASNVEKRRAAVTVTFEQLRKNVDLYEARVRVRYDEASNALESHRGWIFNNEVFMIDPDGKRIESAGLNVTRQEPNEVGIAYLFALGGDPNNHTFVYRTPAVIIDAQVPYELRDIELP